MSKKSTSHSKPVILIIDDEPSFFEGFINLFAQKYEFITATSESEAREKIAIEKFDLILLDLVLDIGKDEEPGINLLKEIRKEDLLIPIIIPSKVGLQILVEAMQLGADDFEEKQHWDASKFSRTLDKHLNQYFKHIQNTSPDSKATLEERLETWKSLRERYFRLGATAHANEAEQNIQSLEYEANLLATVKLTRMTCSPAFFFGDLEWRLNLKVNVLLGKNGFGKTLLLRLLVFLTQPKEEEEFNQLIEKDGNLKTSLALEAQRGQGKEAVSKTSHKSKTSTDSPSKYRFAGEAFGKVPMLAIGEIRYLPRLDNLHISPAFAENAYHQLKNEGAFQFLRRQPEAERFVGLMSILGFKYSSSDILKEERFDKIPVFKLVEDVMFQMTGVGFKFHEVEVIESSNYRFWVKVEDYYSEPVLFQNLSMGMNSIFYIFTLTYLHLEALHLERKKHFGDAYERQIPHEHSIVIIDEIDAHLHPDRQQKIIWLLRRTFPNVQFIVTAHSPLIVSGCLAGEVAILRLRERDAFYIEKYDGHFIGWKVSGLLSRIFGIQERDETFFYYETMASEKAEMQGKINRLEKKMKEGTFSPEEAGELRQLYQDLGYVHVVEKIMETEGDNQQLAAENKRLKSQVRQLQKKLENEKTAGK